MGPESDVPEDRPTKYTRTRDFVGHYTGGDEAGAPERTGAERRAEFLLARGESTCWIDAIRVKCASPKRVAEFWSDLLGWPVRGYNEGKEGFVLKSRHPGAPKLIFLPDDKAREEDDTYLDIGADDLDSAAARVERLGGSVVTDSTRHGVDTVVMCDPEGNIFRLVRSTVSPLPITAEF